MGVQCYSPPMVRLPTDRLYYNSANYFFEHHTDGVLDYELVSAFDQWLQSQNTFIVKSNPNLIRNDLGIAPGFDEFGFDNEEDAIIFKLRWQ